MLVLLIPMTKVISTYPLIWKYKCICSNFLSVEVKQSFISSLSFMRNLTIWMHYPKVHYLFISWSYVPGTSNLWRCCRNIFIKCFFLSSSNLNCQHVFWFKILHLCVPLIHNTLLINFTIRDSIFNNNLRLCSLCWTRLNSNCLILDSFWI